MRSARQEASEPAPGRRGEIGSDPDHIVVAEIEAGRPRGGFFVGPQTSTTFGDFHARHL